jgi:uncharacterized membrane protein
MQRAIHPLHAVLLASTVPLFLGVLLTDIVYFRTYEVQWKNFASWLLVGGLVFAAAALVWALVELIGAGRRVPRTTLRGSFQPALYFVLLLVVWVLGFVNALVHAGDAWASMPTALILSSILMLLTIAATWSGFLGSWRVGT